MKLPEFNEFIASYPQLFNELFKAWVKSNRGYFSGLKKLQFCLPTQKDHASTNNEIPFISNFRSILHDEKYADVSFLVGDEVIKAHKIILIGIEKPRFPDL